MAEVAAALTKSEFFAADYTLLSAELKRISEGAKRLGAAAVRVNPVLVSSMRNALCGSGVAVDCVVGGTGETTARVKAYEAGRAVKEGAREITLVLCRSALKNGRTGDTKREMKKVRRAARRAIVKVAAEESLGYSEILRLARLASSCGIKYLSVPYFPDCCRLRRDLRDSCMLEVTGVENSADYSALVLAGAERIGTSHAEQIYTELMKEAETLAFSIPVSDAPISVAPPAPSVASPVAPSSAPAPSPESDREKTTDGAGTRLTAKSTSEPSVKIEQTSVFESGKMLDGSSLKK